MDGVLDPATKEWRESFGKLVDLRLLALEKSIEANRIATEKSEAMNRASTERIEMRLAQIERWQIEMSARMSSWRWLSSIATAVATAVLLAIILRWLGI